MKSLIFILTLLALGAPAPASTRMLEGQETQNGGGAAEQNFAYALTILSPVYKMCLSISHCVKNEDQRKILEKIHSSLSRELANPMLLRFLPGEWKDFFRDGQVRVAVTGSQVGSTIYLNRNLIYRKEGDDIVPYSLGEAIGLLTHELGHHQGEGNHDLLDLLGANVRAFYESKKETHTVDNFAGHFMNAVIRLEAFHFRDAEAPYAFHSKFWLYAGSRYFDLNEDVRRQMSCPAVGGSKQTLRGYRFYQMHWEEPVTLKSGRIQYPLSARLLVQCEFETPGGKSEYISLPHRARITFDFLPIESLLFYFNGSLKLTVEKIN